MNDFKTISTAIFLGVSPHILSSGIASTNSEIFEETDLAYYDFKSRIPGDGFNIEDIQTDLIYELLTSDDNSFSDTKFFLLTQNFAQQQIDLDKEFKGALLSLARRNGKTEPKKKRFK